jgi:hypothetical protein
MQLFVEQIDGAHLLAKTANGTGWSSTEPHIAPAAPAALSEQFPRYPVIESVDYSKFSIAR